MAEDAKVKIKIDGDSKAAVSSLKAVDNVLKAIKGSIGKVMMAMGLLGLAWEGVQKLVEGVKKLSEWFNRAARESARMKLAEAFDAANQSLDGTIERQKKLNDLFKEANDKISKRNQLRELEANQLKELEAIQRAAARASEIAGVTDPRRRMEIQQRWRVEDEERTREEQREAAHTAAKDSEERVEDLEWKLKLYAGELKKTQEAKAKFGTAGRGGSIVYYEGTEQYKEREAKVAQFNEQIDSLTKAIKSTREELEFERDKSKLLSSHWDNLEELRDQTTAELTNFDETVQFDKKEQEELDRESSAAAKDAESKERERRRERLDAEKNRLSEAEAMQTRFLEVSGQSGNRLTAMGLGGGVATSPVVAKIGSDLARVVELQKKQVDELRELKPSNGANGVTLEP